MIEISFGFRSDTGERLGKVEGERRSQMWESQRRRPSRSRRGWLLKDGKSCRGPEEQVLLRMGVMRKTGKGRVRLSWASAEPLI